MGVRDKFNEVEALSGANLDDTLRGDDVVPSAVGGAGFIGCNVLDQAGLDRVAGLDALVPALSTPADTVIGVSASRDCPLLVPGPDSNVWGDGNILLGGGGSDLIEGRGADDIIDGDKYFSVRLSVRTDANNAATETGSAAGMTAQYLRDDAGKLTGPTLQEAVFAGAVNPGNIVAVREILAGTGGTDTAVFSGPLSNYSIVSTPATETELAKVTVTQTGANVVGQQASDGIDTLRNIERLQFTDQVVTVQVPDAPAIGSATAGNTSATVTFTAPAANASSPITGFEVVVNTGGAAVQTVTGVEASATTATVPGLTNGTSYTFQVRAVNQFGAGPLSAESNAVTPSAAAPGPPTAVTATAGAASATVAWTAPANDGGSPITGSQIEVRTGTTVVTTVSFANAATSQVVTGLANGTQYTFVVRAVNAAGAGTGSAPSNSVTTPNTPGAPVIGRARQGANRGPITASIDWTPPAATGGSAITGYKVTALRMSSAAANATVVSRTDSAVLPATARTLEMTLTNNNYRFVVVAINAVGTSPESARSGSVTPR